MSDEPLNDIGIPCRLVFEGEIAVVIKRSLRQEREDGDLLRGQPTEVQKRPKSLRRVADRDWRSDYVGLSETRNGCKYETAKDKESFHNFEPLVE